MNEQKFYDHKAWLQERQTKDWEPVGGDSPLVVAGHTMLPSAQPIQLEVAQGGRHTDSSVTAAQGTVLRSIPLLVITFIVTAAITGLAWASGLLHFPSFGVYTLTVLSLFGVAAMLLYVAVVRLDLDHSLFGIERRKIGAAENIAISELEARERIAMAALEQHKELVLKKWESSK